MIDLLAAMSILDRSRLTERFGDTKATFMKSCAKAEYIRG